MKKINLLLLVLVLFSSCNTKEDFKSSKLWTPESEYYFGSVSFGKKVTKKFKLFNSGESPTKIVSLKISGKNVNQFKVEKKANNIIAPTCFCHFYISYIPTLKGKVEAVIEVEYYDDNKINKELFLINVFGEGLR